MFCRYVLRRIGLGVPILVGISVIVFALTNVIPGDPTQTLLDPSAPPEARDQLRTALGLNQPLPVQYGLWLGHLVTGDMGKSRSRNVPVAPLVAEAFRNTLILAVFAGVLALSLGYVLGCLAAYHRDSWLDVFVSTASLTGLSLPSFWTGLVMVGLFAVSLRWLPSSGMNSPIDGGGFGDLVRHLILPGITVALGTLGVTMRMTRAAVLEVSNRDSMLTLRAYGLARLQRERHILKNAFASLATVAGLEVGHLLSGAVIVETIFAWPGLGSTLSTAIGQRDLPVIQGAILVSTLAFVVVNIGVDLLQAVLDPASVRSGG